MKCACWGTEREGRDEVDVDNFGLNHYITIFYIYKYI